ncbi:MAG TPA: hypothetical protein VFE62_08640 [Gemmataceae bacterium]|nr:hypothetical protein [Gemmataceae bacterium]
MSDVVVQPILDVKLPALPLPKGEREYRAFLRLLPGLMQSHHGKFVAVHNEQVIDSDSDDIALIQRVHAKIGYVPIHVGLVAESIPVTRVPIYREC